MLSLECGDGGECSLLCTVQKAPSSTIQMDGAEQFCPCTWGTVFPNPPPCAFELPSTLEVVFPLRIQPMLEVDIDWEKLQRKGSFVVQGLANSLAKFLCPPTLLLPLPMVYLPPVWVHLAPAK